MKASPSTLSRLISTLLPLLIGLGLVYGWLFNAKAGEFIADILQTPIMFGALGVLLILSVVLRWVGGFGRKKKAFINFQSDDGSVGISTKAIQDFIERVGKEFAAIKSIQSELTQKKGTLDIAVSVKVRSGSKIPELSQMLQQRIRESVRESLGLEEIGNITIKVQEIVGEPVKVASTEID